MSDATALKRLVAQAALKWVQPNTILGVGTGSTVDCFLDALGEARIPLLGAVSSSLRSEAKLKALGIPVLDLNEVVARAGKPKALSVYIDGADEIDPGLHLVKGGGGALTREKIVADASQTFVCIADASKEVQWLGAFPLPVEVLPMAQSLVQARLEALGGQVSVRAGFTTDNGNPILDVRGLKITDPVALEATINQWPGVVTNGLFAARKADLALIATPEGVKQRQ